MRKLLVALSVFSFLGACSALGFKDTVYVLDAPNGNLRGHASNGSEDKPLSECDPSPKPSGGMTYKCVTHFLPDYQALLLEVDRLQNALKECESNSSQK